MMQDLENKIFNISDAVEFEKIALEVYKWQFENCKVYRDFVHFLNKPQPNCLEEIPFLPISFFKDFEVVSSNLPVQFEFLSSGTTSSIRSKHLVQKPEMYERSFLKIYEAFIGKPSEQVILALLPNYIEQGNSSLVYMVERLVAASDHPLSGFFLQDYDVLISNYQKALALGKEVVIFGVSYALLDLAEKRVDLSKARIIETGGMKGRRKELSKEELHQLLKDGFGNEFISSEYGMTELFSQSYSDKDGLFKMPSWMNVKIRETNDPFNFIADGKTGGINVIDLANLYSCSFIATQDLGKIVDEQLQLMGRFDNADIRGCNLMVE
jgi:hypothetical protein